MRPAPLFTLVEPQMGENIGATARAMLNFGLSGLRIVKPRDGWPNEKAAAMAAGLPLAFHLVMPETMPEVAATVSHSGCPLAAATPAAVAMGTETASPSASILETGMAMAMAAGLLWG